MLNGYIMVFTFRIIFIFVFMIYNKCLESFNKYGTIYYQKYKKKWRFGYKFISIRLSFISDQNHNKI